LFPKIEGWCYFVWNSELAYDAGLPNNPSAFDGVVSTMF
jgi:hypothetical protein